MRLSARVDYALRAAAELAMSPEGPVTAEQLARAQAIPGKFLENILTQLRRAGLVRSQRGPVGGYWLARSPADISRSEEHTSELQSRGHLVCRLLLEKKKAVRPSYKP